MTEGNIVRSHTSFSEQAVGLVDRGLAFFDTASIDTRFVRFGLASIFLVNALVALRSPGDFQAVLDGNLIGRRLSTGFIDSLVGLAAVNDLLLGVAMLVWRRRNLVYFWAAGWLMIVATTKVMNLIWP